MSLASLVAVQAATVTLNPAADTTLFQTYPDNNLGGTPTLVAGTTFGGQSNRALIRFDLTGQLPTKAVITSVSLRLFVMRTIDLTSREFGLHRLRQEWGEGTGFEGNIGRAAQDEEANWSLRFAPDLPWSKPGAGATNDYVAESSATQMIGVVGDYEFSSSNLIADVEFWRTNTFENFGWILICSEEAVPVTSRRFASREDDINAPVLTITYSLPERSSLVLLPAADTALFEHVPDNNLGAADLAGGTIALNLERTRSLLRFDLNSIPTNAVLLDARLRLTMTKSGSGQTGDFELHRLLKSWNEGLGRPLIGDPAANGETTWRMRFHPDVPWTAPGAAAGDDFAPEPTSIQGIDEHFHLQFTNVLNDVNLWRTNSGTNFGWIMISQTEDWARSARRFASRESVTNWPMLEIEYVPQIRLHDVAWRDGNVSFTFDALAFNHYSVECRNAISADPWLVCTNLPLSAYSGPVNIGFPSSNSNRFYRVVMIP